MTRPAPDTPDPVQAKLRYRAHCEVEPSVPLFSRAWWLDAVAGEANWQVALVEKDGRVLASMPYVVQKRLGFTLIKQAQLTPCLGPWLAASAAKYPKRLADEKDLLEALIAQLPRFDHFVQNWNFRYTNWLPFHWHGFSQTTRYTYALPDLSDEKLLWASFQENIRREIRKAENRFELRVDAEPDVDVFLELNRKTFARQGRPLPYPESFIRRLDAACAQQDARRIWIARDPQGRCHAGAYIVHDADCSYYLMGGGDPELRNSGAASQCMWQAIRHAASISNRFDFEGSMIEPVERFFRGFGAVQTPYFHLTKTPSRLIRVRQALLDIIHGPG